MEWQSVIGRRILSNDVVSRERERIQYSQKSLQTFAEIARNCCLNGGKTRRSRGDQTGPISPYQRVARKRSQSGETP